MPGIDVMQGILEAIAHVCGARAHPANTALTVELFAGGALGALLRIAQQLLGSQPEDQEEAFTKQLSCPGLLSVMEAFGLAVPQARACTLVLATQSVLAGGLALTGGACSGRAGSGHPCVHGGRGARPRAPPPPSPAAPLCMSASVSRLALMGHRAHADRQHVGRRR